MMNETKYTSGPWNYGKNDSFGWVTSYTIFAEPEHTKRIGNLLCDNEQQTPNEKEANAKLIAAAPELHAALKRLYAHTPDLDGLEPVTEYDKSLRAAMDTAYSLIERLR